MLVLQDLQVLKILKVVMVLLLVLFLFLPLEAEVAEVIIILDVLVVLDDLVDLAVVLDHQVIQVDLHELLLLVLKVLGILPLYLLLKEILVVQHGIEILTAVVAEAVLVLLVVMHIHPLVHQLVED